MYVGLSASAFNNDDVVTIFRIVSKWFASEKMLSSIFKPASCAIEPLIEAASTSCNKRGACADSASMISKLRGLLVMSANDAFVPTPSFNVIKPSVCKATKARP